MPTWLDFSDHDVEVHAAHPVRYYLQIEQDLGIRLPRTGAVAPRYRTEVSEADLGHVVFVATTSNSGVKDYGVERFAEVGRELLDLSDRQLSFTILLEGNLSYASEKLMELPATVISGLDAAHCVDLFGTAEVVIGNDTGLTHLAALTSRTNGSGPTVVGLYNIFSPLKWTTGSDSHHAVATRFAQLAAMADVDMYINQYNRYIDPALWGAGALLSSIPEREVARFAAECAGWTPSNRNNW